MALEVSVIKQVSSPMKTVQQMLRVLCTALLSFVGNYTLRRSFLSLSLSQCKVL
jgi:hypothetical protein